MKTLILCVATGKYCGYALDLHRSLRAAGVTSHFTIFGDPAFPWPERMQGRDSCVAWPHTPWPLSTMLRYHAYLSTPNDWYDYDLILAMDADLRVVRPLDFAAMAGETVGTLHPGFTGRHQKPGSFYRNPASRTYVPESHVGPYFAGGLVGGTPDGFRDLCNSVTTMIDADLKVGIIPTPPHGYHDESYLNKFFFDHPPATVLGPEYLTPDPSHLWYGDTSEAKILCLNKPKEMQHG